MHASQAASVSGGLTRAVGAGSIRTMPTSSHAAGQAAVQEALDVFLAEQLVGSAYPILESARRDAAETMEHGQALWLATLGYLIIVEIIGQNLARENTTYTRGKSEACFMAGAQEFAARAVTEKDARALYGLRCSLGHEYGLRSSKSSIRHLFALREDGPLVVHPIIDWVQVSDPNDSSKKVWPTATSQNQTWVNVRDVATFVEGLIGHLRAEHAAGRVALAPGVSPLELRERDTFIVT